MPSGTARAGRAQRSQDGERKAKSSKCAQGHGSPPMSPNRPTLRRQGGRLAATGALCEPGADVTSSLRTSPWYPLPKGHKPMSTLGQKQTFAVHQPMSALPPKADIVLTHAENGTF